MKPKSQKLGLRETVPEVSTAMQWLVKIYFPCIDSSPSFLQMACAVFSFNDSMIHQMATE
jgi:hypothetical protein